LGPLFRRFLGAERVLADLERISGERAAVLLCWERVNEPFCYRWILSRRLLARAGMEVLELEHGMLPRWPDAPQPSLFDGEESA
jgi:hypothetical protein